MAQQFTISVSLSKDDYDFLKWLNEEKMFGEETMEESVKTIVCIGFVEAKKFYKQCGKYKEGNT